MNRERTQGNAGACVNSSQNERMLSGVLGGALIGYGLCQRTRAGIGLAALGGALIYRAATGHCPAYELLDINTALHCGAGAAGEGVSIAKSEVVVAEATPQAASWDVVDEASEESFPA